MRLVAEARKEDPELTLNGAVRWVGGRVGVNADTLRGWCRHRRRNDRPHRPPRGTVLIHVGEDLRRRMPITGTVDQR